MSNDTTVQSVLFEGLAMKPVVVHFDPEHFDPEHFDQEHFDQEQTSSDGGAIVLKACDAALDLTARLA